jgi:hypothetical protein
MLVLPSGYVLLTEARDRVVERRSPRLIEIGCRNAPELDSLTIKRGLQFFGRPRGSFTPEDMERLDQLVAESRRLERARAQANHVILKALADSSIIAFALLEDGRLMRVPPHAWLAKGADGALLLNCINWSDDSSGFIGSPLIPEAELNRWLNGEPSQVELAAGLEKRAPQVPVSRTSADELSRHGDQSTGLGLSARQRSSRGDRLVEALLELQREGIDLESHHRGELQKKAMERAGIKDGVLGSSQSTFERALRKALTHEN